MAQQLLSDLADVLRVNLFIADHTGAPILMPTQEYGWSLIAGSWQGDIINKLRKESSYFVYEDPFATSTFAFPVTLGNAQTGFLVMGPLILNKKLPPLAYEDISSQAGLDTAQCLNAIDDIRVVSFNSLNGLIRLVEGISKLIWPEDPFSNALLDTAMTMTGAERGSLMLLNKETGELTVRAARGLSAAYMLNARVKVGEGIAGMAAQSKMPLVLNDTHPDNRIQALLRRPEIKQSVVLPLLSAKEDLVGVLNISTCQPESKMASDGKVILEKLNSITGIF